MKSVFYKVSLALVAAVLCCASLKAQISTTFAKNVTPGQQNGLYYSLPQTMLQLDFTIMETETKEGPLSSYVSYLETTDYVDFGTTEYQLLGVQMKTVVTADPSATFFVTFGSGRGSSKVDFDVLPNGVIRSVGLGNGADVEYAEISVPVAKDIVTVADNQDNGFITLLSEGKSEAQLAKEAADKIEEIRKAKFNLLSGYYETAYDPATFQKMYEKLDEMEQEYMSLFIGKRVVNKVVKTVYVVPSKDVTTQTIAKFSDTDGLTVGTSGTGKPIVVQTLSLNTTAVINAPSQSAIESMSYDNKLFYRIPEMANVKVSFDGNVLFEDRVGVNQLGVLLMAPMSNSRLTFDTETGQIINMKIQ